jgi:outer membrane protein assembly factor BamB
MPIALRRAAIVMVGFAAFAVAQGVAAQANVLWTNSAGSNAITAVDKTTGALLKQFNPAKGNGRGIVVVGNTVYYTVASSGTVFRLDATTGADLGNAFTVPGASGLSTIAYDGTNFWIGDYSGTKNAYYVSPTGTLLKTISLSLCTSFCDGLEFFNGKLISNRGDTLNPGNYDVYDLNGVVLQANFIQTTHAARGIAFDGTNFFVAAANIVYVYDGTTGALIRNFTPGGTGQNFEDLSLDYNIVIPPGPVVGPQAPIPTLSEWSLIALLVMLSISGVFALRRQRR